MPDQDLFAFPAFRALLRTCGGVFVLTFGLVLLDALWGIQLPQPFRVALPWALIVSATLGTVLLVGSLGMPKRTPPEDEPETSADRDG